MGAKKKLNLKAIKLIKRCLPDLSLTEVIPYAYAGIIIYWFGFL